MISHRSFILFHASGTSGSSGIYLLLAKQHAARLPYHSSSIFILHPFLLTRSSALLLVLPARDFRRNSRRSLPLRKFPPFAYSTSYLSPSSCLAIGFSRFYRSLSKVTYPIWFFRCLDYPTKRPLSSLALINDRSLSLYSPTSLDLVVSWSCCLLFSSPTVFAVVLFLCSSRSRRICTPARFPSPVRVAFFPPYFSNLPEIIPFLCRDRLCHRFPSPLTPTTSSLWSHTVYSSRLVQNTRPF